VVVWLPLTRTHRIVSPTTTLVRFEGEKKKFCAVMMCFVAFEEKGMQIARSNTIAGIMDIDFFTGSGFHLEQYNKPDY